LEHNLRHKNINLFESFYIFSVSLDNQQSIKRRNITNKSKNEVKICWNKDKLEEIRDYDFDLYERRKSTKIKNVFFLHFLIHNIILQNLSKIWTICLINNNVIR
jgi:hypothetical protein